LILCHAVSGNLARSIGWTATAIAAAILIAYKKVSQVGRLQLTF
jgi:hypothetical protein